MPNEVFNKGNYQFSSQFEKTLFGSNVDNCLKLEILSNESVMLSEPSFTKQNLQDIGTQIDFDISLNTVGTLKLRVVPLCLRDIMSTEVNVQKIISN